MARLLLAVEYMTTEDFIRLLITGSALGAAARYLLALNIKLPTAIYGGVLVLVAGPWVLGRLGAYFAGWTTFDLAGAAIAAVLFATVTRAAVTRIRRKHLKRQRVRGGQLAR